MFQFDFFYKFIVFDTFILPSYIFFCYIIMCLVCAFTAFKEMLNMLIDIFFGSLSLVFIFTNSLSEKIKWNYKFILFICVFLSNYLCYTTPLMTSSAIFICILFVIFTTKNKLINTIASLSCYFISVVFNNLMLVFLQNCFSIDVPTLYSITWILITFLSFFLFFCYFLSYFFGLYM